MPSMGSFLIVLIDHMHIHRATDPWQFHGIYLIKIRDILYLWTYQLFWCRIISLSVSFWNHHWIYNLHWFGWSPQESGRWVAKVRAGCIARKCMCDQSTTSTAPETKPGVLVSQCLPCTLVVVWGPEMRYILCNPTVGAQTRLHLRYQDPFDA